MINSIRFEDVSCPLGCPRNDEIVLTGRDMIHNLPGQFTIVKCRTCQLMRTNPRPTRDTIGFFYPDDYDPYLSTQVQQSKSISKIKKLFKPFVKRIFKYNNIKLPSITPGRMLEIGCASGMFLHEMASIGWDVHGIEFSEKAAQTASKLGYQVQASSLETAVQPDKKFDLFTGWMVLEHLHDPIGGLQKLREWANPGAWLVLSVPNNKSLEFRLFKEKLYSLHLPNHLYHFTPQTLDLVLQAGGWRIEKIYHQRLLTNLIVSTGYVIRDRGYVKLGQKFINFPLKGGNLSYILFPLALMLSLLGQTGRITVWARLKK